MTQRLVTKPLGVTNSFLPGQYNGNYEDLPGVFRTIDLNFTDLFNTVAPSLGPVMAQSGSATTDLANAQSSYGLAATQFQTVTGESDPIGYGVINLGPGLFNVNTSGALMNASVPAGKVRGLVIRGAGSNVTTISYSPAVAGPMLINQRWQNIQFEGITFLGQGNAAQSNLIENQEQGGVTNIQYNYFRNCSFDGVWNNIEELTGGNNNSEHVFDRCAFGGNLGYVVHVGETNTSDQFLNYWFNNCKWSAGSGGLVSMFKGGSIHVKTLDVSGWAPPATATFTGSIDSSGILTASSVTGILAPGQLISAPAFTATGCSISGTTLTIGTVTSGTVAIGCYVDGPDIAPGITGLKITAGSGTSWTVNRSQTVASTTMYGNFCVPGTFITATNASNGAVTGTGGAGTYNTSAGVTVASSSMTAATPLFALLGNTHSQGVQSFDVQKLRIEHKSDFSPVMCCSWAGGNVSFKQVDQSSQVGARTNPTLSYFNFAIVNNTGPEITFQDSNLLGMHSYITGVNNFGLQSRIHYLNNRLLQNLDPFNFINWVAAGNTGGAPRICFDGTMNGNVSGTVGYHDVLDCDLFAEQSSGGLTRPRITYLNGGNSDYPINGGATVFKLPMNCTVREVFAAKDANGNSGAFNYVIKTTDGVTTLGTFTGTDASQAATYTTGRINFFANTQAKRLIEIIDTQTRAGIFTNARIGIEYI
jgi:hypothetical protein